MKSIRLYFAFFTAMLFGTVGFSQFDCEVNVTKGDENYPQVALGTNNPWNTFDFSNTNVSLKEAAYLMSTNQCNTNTITFDASLDGQTINVSGRAILLESVAANSAIVKTIDASNVPNLIISGPGGGSADYSSNPVISVSSNNWTLIGLNVSGGDQDGVYAKGVQNLTITNGSFNNNGQTQNIGADWVGIPGYQEYGSNDGVQTIDYAGIHIEESVDFLIQDVQASGNKGHGIQVVNSSVDVNADGFSGILLSNDVGVTADGSGLLGNFGDGVLIVTSSDVLIDGNHISGNGNRSAWDLALGDLGSDANSALNTRNFYGAGIELQRGGNHTLINNFVGTNADGSSITTALGDTLGNHKHGIYVRASINNQIGEVGKGNIVGGNGFAFSDVHTIDSDPTANVYVFGVGHGIQLHDNQAPVSGNVVQANYIGLFNGNCIPNSEDGISLLGYENVNTNNLIGGTNTGEGNVIGGSKFGIVAQGSGVTGNDIFGNFIGTEDGLTDVGCPVESGIKMQSGSNGNTIGGSSEGEGNTIVFTTVSAVVIDGEGSDENEVLGNVMRCNPNGIQLIDNGNINLGNAIPSRLVVNTATLSDTLLEGFSPNEGDSIDVYIADTCADATPTCQSFSGVTEKAAGMVYVGSFVSTSNDDYSVLIDATGDQVVPEGGFFTFDFKSDLAVDNGLTVDNVVFAARDAVNNTSEFHSCINVNLCLPPKAVDFNSGTDFYLCPDDEAEIITEIETETNDNADASLFNYALISVEDSTEIETNATGTFTIVDSGYYVVEGYNTILREKCSTFSLDTIKVDTQEPVSSAVISSGDEPFCAGDENVTFDVTGTDSSTFSWTLSNDATFTGSGSSINIPLLSEDFVVTVIETTDLPFGCTQPEVDFDVTVNEVPVVSIIEDPAEIICSQDGVVFNVSSPNISSRYIWSYGDEAVGDPAAGDTTSSSSSTVDFGPVRAGVSVIEISEFGCVSEPDEYEPITSFCGLEADFKDPDRVCFGETVVLEEDATHIHPSVEPLEMWYLLPGADIDSVSISDGETIRVNYSQPGSYDVTMIVRQAGETDTARQVGYFIVDSIPDVPDLISLGEDFCEGEETMYSLDDAEPTSTYTWTLPDGTIFTSGSSTGVGNDEIEVRFGANSGEVTVLETTTTGCVSSVAKVDANIQRLLGDFDIRDFTEGKICDAGSIDSLASYDMSWEFADSIEFSVVTPDFLNSVAFSSVNEGYYQFSFVVPEGETSPDEVVTVKALANAGTCDVDSVEWKLEVRPNATIRTEFDKRDVCELESSLFTAQLDSSLFSPSAVGEGEFQWFYNGAFVETGSTYNTPDVIDGDFISVVYVPNSNDCPHLESSVLTDSTTLKAWDYPIVDGTIFGEDEYTVTDFSQIKLDYVLENPELGGTYNHNFYWRVDDDSLSQVEILSPNGSLSFNNAVNVSIANSIATLETAPSDLKERTYLVEVSVKTDNGDICKASDEMILNIELLIDPGNFLCHEPESSEECPVWEVKNSEPFENKLTIFNRWGSIVYESENGLITWNGTNMSGQDLPTGTYFYVIEITDSKGLKEFNGPLSIIK